VRFSEDNPEDLDRARAAVAVWREKYPDKTADRLVAELGPEFHPEYEPVLRGMLFRYDEDHAETIPGQQ
jgi:hypothetical protein